MAALRLERENNLVNCASLVVNGQAAAAAGHSGAADCADRYLTGLYSRREPQVTAPTDTTAPIDPATRQSVRTKLRLEE